MARMLGRARKREIDPRDDEWFTDAAGARRGQRHRERQEVVRELAPVADDDWRASIGLLIDLSDCRHGCNADCIVLGAGSDVCDFLCHPGLTTDPVWAARFEAKLRELEA